MQKVALTLILSISISIIYGQALLRGPYLQKQTSTSMNVKWRTDIASDSRVYYGSSPTTLTQSMYLADTVRDHEVAITGLQPFTKYYYKIESNGTVLSGGDNNHHFKTAPVPGTVQPVRIWATGDFGKGNTGQRDTRESYLNFNGNADTDVWLWLGDNAYNDGTDQEYQDKVFSGANAFGEIFKNMHFYPCPGNHDYNSVCPIPCGQDPVVHNGPYFNIISVPTNGEAGGLASNYELYYSFDYANVHFISLNSELGSQNASYDWNGVYTNGHQTAPFLQWLEQDLQQNTKPWVVAFWHQPPYSKGSHNSDDVWEIYMKAMRNKIIPVLENHGVDIILNGHSHVFERSYMIKGHYANSSNSFDPAVHLINGTSGNETIGEKYIKYTDGPNPNQGTVYVVSGNAGSSESNPDFNTKAHPVMYYSDGGSNACGSFIMDVNDNKLTGKYLSTDGTIKDQFTIEKQSVTGIKSGYDFFKNVKGVSISPNPFSSKTFITYELVNDAQMKLELYSLDGKQSYSVFNGRQTAGKQEVVIDASTFNLASGNYILKIADGNATAYEKLIKVN